MPGASSPAPFVFSAEVAVAVAEPVLVVPALVAPVVVGVAVALLALPVDEAVVVVVAYSEAFWLE
jgi:hypothetical protein